MSSWRTGSQRSFKEKVTLSQSESWTMQKLMTTLDVVLKQEEEIELQMPKKPPHQQQLKEMGRTEYNPKQRTPFCLYCDNTEHWSVACTKITQPKARSEHLKKNQRCICCGSKNHPYAQCKGRGCLKCRKKHHTSICFRSSTETSSALSPSYSKSAVDKKKDERSRTSQFHPGVTKRRIPFNGNNENFTSTHSRAYGTSCSPRHWSRLFFIDAKLAKELDLPIQGTSTSTMTLRPFGSQHPKKVQCITTSMCIWDVKGVQHQLQLYTHDNLSRNLTGGKLDKKDL
ncbi:unnamed protein product [Heligmosomoides polygyrus]|uniref:Nucleic-acid-binding protein from transposon X-element n=1 Tax=Heligmosomoides polygyrus TaxID=6339 RepID=A0A183F7H2_HELPZ|nr:unnamed protein product [Heligmosomoides polygyrus]